MNLSWNEIKSRALAFSRQWADACYEDGQAKPFLIDFFEVFGITNKNNDFLLNGDGVLESILAALQQHPSPSIPLPAKQEEGSKTPLPHVWGEGANLPSPHSVGRGVGGEGRTSIGEGRITAIEAAAHPGATLADLYDPLTMPPDLPKAPQALDKAVDAAYGYKGAATDAARVAFLSERYQQLASLLPAEKATKVGKKKTNG